MTPSRRTSRGWSMTGVFFRVAPCRCRKRQPPSRRRVTNLQRDHLIWRISPERRIQIGEAPDLHPRHRVLHPALAWLRASAALAVAPARLTLRKPALERTHVADHEEHALLLRHARQALAERIAPAQREDVVVEEEHAGHVDAVGACLELRQDHVSKLVA